VAEEMYLYPAVREHVPGGQALADKEIQDHATVEKLHEELEKVSVDQPEFDDLVDRLISEVSAHIADEEEHPAPTDPQHHELLRAPPALADVCSPGGLDDLGDKIGAARKTAPTCPDLSTPDIPPGNKLLAPGAGLVDRARDFVTGRGSEPRPRAPRPRRPDAPGTDSPDTPRGAVTRSAADAHPLVFACGEKVGSPRSATGGSGRTPTHQTTVRVVTNSPSVRCTPSPVASPTAVLMRTSTPRC
jgi:hypothetical protein